MFQHPRSHPRRTGRRRALAVGLLLGLALVAGACSSDDEQAGEPTTSAAAPDGGGGGAELVEGATVLDVRTPEEFAEGHLEGAVLADVQAADFAEQVAALELDPEAQVQVYCRSGNRSAVAADALREMGYADVVDLGGVAEAAEATGLDVVT